MESIVEDAALDWLRELGYEVLTGLTIAPGEPAMQRSDYNQVFLFDRLRTKLENLNPTIPLELLQEALRKIRLVSHPTLIENNRSFHRLLAEGVDVEFRNADGQIVHDKVWLIDFATPEANEFHAVNKAVEATLRAAGVRVRGNAGSIATACRPSKGFLTIYLRSRSWTELLARRSRPPDPR